jgi:hypothetical protein
LLTLALFFLRPEGDGLRSAKTLDDCCRSSAPLDLRQQM